jgi:hypothetical protein
MRDFPRSRLPENLETPWRRPQDALPQEELGQWKGLYLVVNSDGFHLARWHAAGAYFEHNNPRPLQSPTIQNVIFWMEVPDTPRRR